MQWAALLAISIVLPNITLIWFMTRAVANERLVTRQKLAPYFQDKLAVAGVKTADRFNSFTNALDGIRPTGNPYAAFHQALEQDLLGVVVWDEYGSLTYPQSTDALGDIVSQGPLAAAWQLEFAAKQYEPAAQLYEIFAADSNPCVALAATMGRSRCLVKLGHTNEAVQVCESAAFAPITDTRDSCSRLLVENARLLLLSLLKQAPKTPAHQESFRRCLTALRADLYNTSGDRALLPANQNLFLARKLLQITCDTPDSLQVTNELERMISAEELSLTAAETIRPFAGPIDTVFKINIDVSDSGTNTPAPIYAVRHRNGSATVLAFLSENAMASLFRDYRDALATSATTFRVTDANGNTVAGSAPDQKPFDTAPLPLNFPGWKVELFLIGGEAFEQQAAHRMIAVYVWTAVLVIFLVLVASAFALRALGRQMQLNKMKNDFVATVSHELKTPLASMRVLIDTLLEGHVRDEAQARNYLQMTARENERLSRMIESFLTFSRMERNKTAFTITETNAGAIASDAVESVKTKFTANQCKLTVNVDETLPDVQADHDAMVTVLVNLLDNACKYTTEEKQIGLSVFAENGTICFAVSDNGIGIARRHVRKIFDSFYQVDNSLARKAEGCGLGLSIVKFIVDAHRGAVIVDSKPGKGSTFTVKLPVARKSGHGNIATHETDAI